MPGCDTRYFGPVEYEEHTVIRMVQGPLGFEEDRAFLLLQRPEQYPLVYMQSVLTPRLCFLALPVLAVARDYALQLTREDAEVLRMAQHPQIGVDALCLVLLTARPDGATANLLAPVVVNLKSRSALQCLNVRGTWSHQHALDSGREAAA